ncbi:MAG: ParA family protein [Anaerolineales bacterium]|nr:ParA family protein [Anaerolineales bacterium]
MVISVANQKGGVAKTTTAINVAAGLTQLGYKVLLIDSDPQANVTQVFIHPQVEIELDQSLYHVLVNFAPLSPIIRSTGVPNLDFVPSHIRLSGVDLELAQAFDNRSARLHQAIQLVRDRYDYIIIDNPPSLGLLTINSFVASQRLIIPVSTAFFALTGLVQLQETITMVQQHQLNPDLSILGVVCTFTETTNVSRDVEQQLRQHFGELVFETTIPKNVSLEEAHSNHSHVFDHAPTSKGAEAYKALVQELLARP